MKFSIISVLAAVGFVASQSELCNIDPFAPRQQCTIFVKNDPASSGALYALKAGVDALNCPSVRPGDITFDIGAGKVYTNLAVGTAHTMQGRQPYASLITGVQC